MAARRRRFTPYRPPTPPAGSYDPSLDAQVAASRRGLTDLRGDLGTAQARDVTDYAMGQQDLTRQYGQTREDLARQWQQHMADLDTAYTRGSEDYGRNTQLLGRRYGILGNDQKQQMNVAGVISGGAMLQAAAKRAANQGIEQQGLDTDWSRRQQDLNLDRQRSTDEGNIMQQRALDQYNLGLGRLGLDYALPDGQNPLGGRRYQDRLTQLTRAEREQTAFGLDVGAQRAYQAAGAGWDPDPRPSNEFGSGANVHRVVREGNMSVAYRPNGSVLWRRPVRRR